MKKIARIAITIMVVFAFPLYVFTSKVTAATLTNGYVTLSDSRPSTASVTYTIGFQGVTASTIKCVNIQFSDAATGGSKPTGMTITGATLGGTTTLMPTPGSWTATPNNATGAIPITYVTGETGTNGIVVISAVTNGSSASTPYYIQFSTYNNVDCVSSPVDSSVIAFIYTTGVTVSATVDPSLSFSLGNVASGQTVNSATTNAATTTATAVNFGVVTSATNKIAAHDLIVSTNAINGYTVYVKSTGALTYLGATITNWTGTNAAPTTFTAAGTEAFGYTTASTSLSGTAARFSSNKWAGYSTAFDTPTIQEVARATGTVSNDTTRVGYQVAISGATEAGVYTTTVVYSAVPTY